MNLHLMKNMSYQHAKINIMSEYVLEVNDYKLIYDVSISHKIKIFEVVSKNKNNLLNKIINEELNVKFINIHYQSNGCMKSQIIVNLKTILRS